MKSTLQKFFRQTPEKKFDPLENPIQWESFPDLRAEITDLKEVIRIRTTTEVVPVSPYTILPGRVEPLEGSSGLLLAQRMSAYAIRLEGELAESRKLAERHWNSLTRLRKKNKLVGNPNKKEKEGHDASQEHQRRSAEPHRSEGALRRSSQRGREAPSCAQPR